MSNYNVTYAGLPSAVFVQGAEGGSIGPTLSSSTPGSKVKSMKIEDGLLVVTTPKGIEILIPLSNVLVMRAGPKAAPQIGKAGGAAVDLSLTKETK